MLALAGQQRVLPAASARARGTCTCTCTHAARDVAQASCRQPSSWMTQSRRLPRSLRTRSQSSASPKRASTPPSSRRSPRACGAHASRVCWHGAGPARGSETATSRLCLPGGCFLLPVPALDCLGHFDSMSRPSRPHSMPTTQARALPLLLDVCHGRPEDRCRRKVMSDRIASSSAVLRAPPWAKALLENRPVSDLQAPFLHAGMKAFVEKTKPEFKHK